MSRAQAEDQLALRVFARMHQYYGDEQDPELRAQWTGIGLDVSDLVAGHVKFWCCMHERSFPAHVNARVRNDFTVLGIPTNRLYFYASGSGLSGSFSVIDDALTRRAKAETETK